MDDCDDLPSEYDTIVIGTGLVECIVAAAVSRAGKKVLHLDSNSYYGAEWATVGLDGLLEILKDTANTDETIPQPSIQHENLTTVHFRNFRPIQAAAMKWYQTPFIPDPPSEEESVNKKEKDETTQIDSAKVDDDDLKSENSNLPENTSEGAPRKVAEEQNKPIGREDILKLSRKFNIDLAPKVVYSRGPMVQTLLQSGVSRYVEFMSVQTLALVSDRIERVPATKSEVFASRAVSPLEKRALMATVSSLADALNQEDCGTELFFDRLTKAGLPPRLAPYVAAMAGGEPMSSAAAARLKEFLSSAGRFAASPLLWPLYGSGELLQAFARLAAVYGAIYWLGRDAEAFVVGKTGAAEGILSRGRLLKCQNVVVPSYRMIEAVNESTIFRAILLADKPLAAHDREAILHFSPNSQDRPVRLLQLSHYTSACPPPFYLFHVTGDCAKAVMQCIDVLFCKGQILKSEAAESETLEKSVSEWMSTPTQVTEGEVIEKPNLKFLTWLSVASQTVNNSNLPEGIHVCPGQDSSLDFPNAISQAEEIFRRMYPEEEFLPKIPDPDEALECDGSLVESAPEEAFSTPGQIESTSEGNAEEIREESSPQGNIDGEQVSTGENLSATTENQDISSNSSIPVKVALPSEDM